MTLDEELKKEHNKALAYIHSNKPFKFIDYLKNKFKVTNTNKDLYNWALDDYNYLRREGVRHDAVYFSLKRLTTNIMNMFYKENEK